MDKKRKKKRIVEVITFPIPYTLNEVEEILPRKNNNTSPGSKENIMNAAFKSHSKGNILEAEKYYQDFIKQGFTDYRVYFNYGVILKDLDKLQKAEVSTRKAIELKPDFADAYYNLGLILKDLNNLKEAELSQRKAIKLKPNFAEAHSHLGTILRNLGKLKEAELSHRKAIELQPQNILFKDNLINLLTVYKPSNTSSNNLYEINEEFQKINLIRKNNNIITDNEAIKIYNNGLAIYRKYNLNLETSLSQIYKSNEVNLNCKRHLFIFKKHKIIPEFCFGCYKVQVEVNSILELIKLFLVFNNLKLKNNNSRKCMIELRPNISGFYKGLIYCFGLDEALDISKQINVIIQNNIRIDLKAKVKRGCSEYPLEFPEYKEIKLSGKQPMNYVKNWKNIENEIDKRNKNWGKQSKSLEGFNLNNFLIIRNWIAYARKIGDLSFQKITNEEIQGPEKFKNLNRSIHLK